MSWFKFIEKIKPDGKAFRGAIVDTFNYTKILYEVIADGLKEVIDYADFQINDQVWYVNDNFDPIPWEARYNITPSPFSTLAERREIVKAYMLYPQSANRLSRDYIQSEIDNLGFTNVTVEYNSSGASDGFLHANSIWDEKGSFSTGALSYNSFIVSGNIDADSYPEVLNTVLGLKPLQVAVYNKLETLTAIAIDDSLAWALDDSLAIALTKL